MSTPAPPSTEQPSAKTESLSALRDLLRLGLKGCILLAAVMLSLTAIVRLISDENDYDQVVTLKHQRLTQYQARKIVLVGGSNLAYGADSKMIERETGCPVVNMGLNGYLGIRYMLEEVKDDLHPGDIVVIAFEWDNFYKPVDGTPESLLGLVKTRPMAFMDLSFTQKIDVLASIPVVAQQKIFRVVTETLQSFKNRLTGRTEYTKTEAVRYIMGIESLAGFSPEGDQLKHLSAPWPFPRDGGVIPPGSPIESQAISLMRDFAVDMKKRDVSVMVSYTPAIRYFFDKYQDTFNEVHARIVASSPLVAPSPPASFAFDERYFYDTVYHLNVDGRPLRTQKVIDDLKSILHERARCSGAVTAQTGE